MPQQTEDNWRRRNQQQQHQPTHTSSSIFSLSSSSPTSNSAKRFYAQQSHPPAEPSGSLIASGNLGVGVSQGNGQKGSAGNGHGAIGSERNHQRLLDLDKGREKEREMEREQWRKAAVAAAAGIGAGPYHHSSNSFDHNVGGTYGSAARNRAMGALDHSLSPATPLQPLHTGPAFRTSAPDGVDGAAHAENWALTPVNSLPSLPGTPSRSHQVDFWSQRSNAAPNRDLDPSRGSLRNASPRPPILSPPTNASSPRNAPLRFSGADGPSGLASSRTSSPKLSNSSPSFASPTHPSLARVAATGSPKRSPLSLPSSNQNPPSVSSLNASNSRPVPLSPISANKRSLSPATSPLLGSELVAQAPSASNRTSIAYALANATGVSSQGPPGNPTISRRGSSNSLASMQGHSLTHSRRASQIHSSAQSITSNGTNASSMIQSYGVYRPPHLRRDSIHALKPAVAHYDRIRTPSLRGQSRSRESSVSVTSRAGSRPPSAVPFNHPNTIPEDGVTESRPRLGSFGSFLHGADADSSQEEILEDDDYFGKHAQVLNKPEGSSDQPSVVTPTPGDGPDASELEAKLKIAGDTDRYSQDREVVSGEASPQPQNQGARSEMTDDVDLSFEDMMNPSITESYCASRRGSVLGDAVDIFEVGDRLGPGMEHDGYTIRIAETSQGFKDQPEDIGLSGSQLEVVRKLGEGSYAVVYLVREVDPSEETHDRRKEDGSRDQEEIGAFGPAEDNSKNEGKHSLPVPNTRTSLTNPNANPISWSGRSSLGTGDESFGGTEGDRTVAAIEANAEENYSSTLKASDALSPFSSRDRKEKFEAREFALKCLCKRDLSPEMLEVQRLEATIHQSIPRHPNIVTLYRTYETPEWLFLIIEYCPGQDLYYWLEQAQDTAEPLSASASNSGEESGADEAKDEEGPRSLEATPPSPSLLASTAGQSLLSRKRLRLVASMFVQMCEAVQFCHDRGISHRDLKPENFIVEDRRQLDDGFTDLNSSFTESNKSAGGDSKVIVKLTDFGLASAEDRCRDFECGSKPYMAFETLNNVTDWYDPFQADTWSLGVVLLNIIFHRSPFSEPSVERCESFAAYCYDHIKFLTESFEGLSESAASFLADNVFCEVNPDSETRSRITPKEFAEWVKRLPDHLLASSTISGNLSGGFCQTMTHSLEHSRTNSLASTLPSLLSSPGNRHRELVRSSLSPFANEGSDHDNALSALRSETPDILPTPSFSPIPPPLDNEMEDDEPEEMLRDEQRVEEELGSPSKEKDESGLLQPAEKSLANSEPTILEEPENLDQDPEKQEKAEGSEFQSPEPSESDMDSLKQPLSAASSNPKRRKRGARKGRTAAKLEQKQELKRSQSVGQLMSLEDRAARRKHDRDAVIAELAAASETLAREMSKVSKNRALSSQASSSSMSNTSAALRSSGAPSPTSTRPPYLAPLAPIPPFVKERALATAESPTSPRILLNSKDSVESTSSSSAFSKFSWDRSRTTSISNSTAPPLSRGQSGEEFDFLSRDGAGSNWDSAANRRERMISHRKGPTLQDSGRIQPMSWREKNQSTTTLSSIASTNTVSSMSSISSTGSSIYSTASAPAALPRKSDSSSRHRSRPIGPMGLGTIDERRKKEIDATYLATVFGGDPRQNQRPGSKREKFDTSKKKSSSSNLSLASHTASTTSEDTAGTPVRRETSENRLASSSGGLQRQSSSSTASIGRSSNATVAAEERETSPPVESSPASKKSNPSGLAKFLRSVRSYNSNSNSSS